MPRSLFTLDLGAIRHNVSRLVDVLDGSELWAVVKADGYGHGATDVARAALEAGASALCVATVGEALLLRPSFPGVRTIVMGPTRPGEVSVARAASLELVLSQGVVPEDVPIHLKLDTGMGRWGLSELPSSGRQVVGLMTHFASADSDPDFTALQLERFIEAAAAFPELPRHAANSAAALSFPAARLEAARCGIALYGISPFGGDPADDGLRPALRWESEVAEVRVLAAGESTGYGRRYVAEQPTRIGLVPVGYADGFRRDMTGTEVVVAGQRSRVVGTVSMDAIAIVLPDAASAGDVVTLRRRRRHGRAPRARQPPRSATRSPVGSSSAHRGPRGRSSMRDVVALRLGLQEQRAEELRARVERLLVPAPRRRARARQRLRCRSARVRAGPARGVGGRDRLLRGARRRRARARARELRAAGRRRNQAALLRSASSTSPAAFACSITYGARSSWSPSSRG